MHLASGPRAALAVLLCVLGSACAVHVSQKVAESSRAFSGAGRRVAGAEAGAGPLAPAAEGSLKPGGGGPPAGRGPSHELDDALAAVAIEWPTESLLALEAAAQDGLALQADAASASSSRSGSKAAAITGLICAGVLFKLVVLLAAWHTKQGLALERATAPPVAIEAELAKTEVPPLQDSFMQNRPAPPERPARDSETFMASNQGGSIATTAAEVREPSNTFLGTIFTLVAGGLGAGIFCLPWAAAGATLFPALVTIGAVLLVNYWTITILVEAADRQQVFDIGNLLGRMPAPIGGWLQLITNIIIWLSMFLCLISYYVVISDSAMMVMGKNPLTDTGLRYGVLAVTAAALMPLCFLDITLLSYTSMMTPAVNVFIFAVIIRDLATNVRGNHYQRPCIFKLGLGTVAMASTTAQCVIIQMCVLPIYEDMKARTPRKFSHAVAVSFCLLYLLFGSFAVAGQVAYGTEAEPNVLKNFRRDALGLTANGGTVLAIACVFPIMLIPMVQPLRSEERFRRFVNPIIVGLELGACLVAFFVTDLGVVNIINGALCVGIFVGIIPAVVGYYFMQSGVPAMVALAIGGTVMSVLGFIYMSNYPPETCTISA